MNNMPHSRRMVKWALLVCASIVLHSPFSTLRSQDSTFTLRLGDSVAVELVWVEGGTFTMGSNETPKGVRLTYDAARPEHRVTVSGFYMARTEVTQALWKAVMGENPSKWRNDSLPVECVSWDEAQQFTILLSQMTGRRFRLPSEAEWEFAARGGERRTDASLPYAGTGRAMLDSYCWYCVNSTGCTHPVGQLKPNALGLYDMCGNVAEWCQDWMEPYTAAEQRNPQGPKTGENRVLRGGHYNSVSAACTVFDRGWYLPSGKYEFYGFRLVMDTEN